MGLKTLSGRETGEPRGNVGAFRPVVPACDDSRSATDPAIGCCFLLRAAKCFCAAGHKGHAPDQPHSAVVPQVGSAKCRRTRWAGHAVGHAGHATLVAVSFSSGTCIGGQKLTPLPAQRVAAGAKRPP